MMFIDGSNIFHACKEFESGFGYSPVKLRAVLTEDVDLIRAHYYGSIPIVGEEQIESQNKFHHFLEYNGFRTVIMPLRRRPGTNPDGTPRDIYIEKGVDTALVTDMLQLGYEGAYDLAILVAGDADYVRTIQAVERRGIKVHVAFFDPPLIAGDLRRAAHHFISLNELADDIRR